MNNTHFVYKLCLPALMLIFGSAIGCSNSVEPPASPLPLIAEKANTYGSSTSGLPYWPSLQDFKQGLAPNFKGAETNPQMHLFYNSYDAAVATYLAQQCIRAEKPDSASFISFVQNDAPGAKTVLEKLAGLIQNQFLNPTAYPNSSCIGLYSNPTARSEALLSLGLHEAAWVQGLTELGSEGVSSLHGDLFSEWFGLEPPREPFLLWLCCGDAWWQGGGDTPWNDGFKPGTDTSLGSSLSRSELTNILPYINIENELANLSFTIEVMKLTSN